MKTGTLYLEIKSTGFGYNKSKIWNKLLPGQYVKLIFNASQSKKILFVILDENFQEVSEADELLPDLNEDVKTIEKISNILTEDQIRDIKLKKLGI